MAKKAQPWEAVFDRVKPQKQQPRQPKYVYPVPITDTALNELELQLECRLPESYRAFMKRFGPGVVSDRIRLLPLGIGSDGNSSVIGDTRGMRDLFINRMGERLRPNAAWLGRLVYFGSDFYGDTYAWDTEDVTNSKTHEYRVYHLQRATEQYPEMVGQTLADLLQWAHTQNLEGGEGEPDIEFSPWGVIREKVKPSHSDVMTWLKFNNNAVYDLAYAIRDDDQPGAFPILADALQEAGCTNADLLYWCRHGDPDIDGMWVLRVLLD